MKKMQKILLGLALVMLVASSVRPALSYFTTYVTAKGGYAVHISENSQIEENIDDLTKKITVANTDAKTTEYVRARAITSSRFPVTYTLGENWVKGTGDDKFYYYTEALAPGASTATSLDVTIELPKDLEKPENADFNVVFIYESVPVLYDKKGKPLPYNDPATWSQTITTEKQEGGNK